MVPIPTTQVLVQSVRRPPKQEAAEHKQHLKRKRLTEEAAHASSVAARELRAVVSLASRRGLNAEEIFQHFVVDDSADVQAGEENVGCRCAGKNGVIKGMEGLGISLSEEAAGLLIEAIVRSSEPPGWHSTRHAGDSGQPRRNANEPLRVRKERGSAAFAGDMNITTPKRAKGASPQRSAAGRKNPPTPLREHITAEDLWNFASRGSAQGSKAQSGSEDATMRIEIGEKGSTSADEESLLPALSQEEATNHPNKSTHGRGGPLSMRKRARNMGNARGGGSANKAARDGVLEENPRGMGSTGPGRPVPASATSGGGNGSIAANSAQPKNLALDQQTKGNHQASFSTMSSFSAAGNATNAPTTRALRQTNNLDETVGEGAPRPRSMPTQVGSVDSRRKRDLEESAGGLLGPRRRQTLPACGGSVAVAPAAMSSASYEKAEVASFPCDDPALEATDGKDRVFHVDRCDGEASVTRMLDLPR